MSNPKYVKGRRKEYKIMKQCRNEGYEIVLRSAGSHSPIDVIAIDPQIFHIRLIQYKGDSMSEKEKQRLYDSLSHLEGLYNVEVEVL